MRWAGMRRRPGRSLPVEGAQRGMPVPRVHLESPITEISSLNVRFLAAYFVEGGKCYALSGIDNIRGTNRGKKL